MPSPTAPSHLTKESKRLWRNILNDFVLEDGHDLRLLEAACQAWDRVLEARDILKKEGSYFTDRFDQVKPHPALKTELQSAKLFAQLVRELGLDIETTPETPRRPRKY